MTGGCAATIKSHIETTGHKDRAAAPQQGPDAGFIDDQEETFCEPKRRWNPWMLDQVIKDEASAIRWCQEEGLLPDVMFCKKGHRMQESARHKGFPRFRCQKEGCKEEFAITSGTWLEHSHLPVSQILK